MIKLVVVVLMLPLVMLPHMVYAAMDDASFQDCLKQLAQKTGISFDLLQHDPAISYSEHEILVGNLSAGSSNSINIYNNTMNNVPDPMKEQLSTCMNTGVLP